MRRINMDDNVDRILERQSRRPLSSMDDLEEDASNPYVESGRPNPREDYDSDEQGTTSQQSRNGRTILGRDNSAEARVEYLNNRQQRSQDNSEGRHRDIDSDIEGADDDQAGRVPTEGDTNQADTSSGNKGSYLDRSASQVGFIGRLILFALAALLIFTMGKYAFDSLFVINKSKTITDLAENYEKAMGQTVEETENYVKDIIYKYTDSEDVVTDTVPYTYNKREKSITFTVENREITWDVSSYSNYKFKKKGGRVKVELVINKGDKTLVNCTILEVLKR